jgi:16S rRNA (guanine(1405)-N(7))-methyltransferase
MSTQTQDDQLEKLVETVLASPKYKEVCDDLIRGIGLREIAKRSNLKEAIKTTKSKLHQVGGAYLADKKDYSKWLDDLKHLFRFDSRENFLAYLEMIMNYHTSTKERLPILDQFYKTILADLPPIHSVLDIACGFNPLALPWMPLTEPVEYYACDIYKDMKVFLDKFLALMQVQGQVRACDVAQSCPTNKVDVAFVLKTLPCLEQVDKSAGFKLLQIINANYIVVSFPVHSLGGKAKGMEVNYEAKFRALVENTEWLIKKYEFPTELAFLIMKQGNTS